MSSRPVTDLPAPAVPRRQGRWAVLIVAVVLVVFGRTGRFAFVTFDDEAHLLVNPHLHPFDGRGLAAIWAGPYNGLYIPATYTAWGVLSVFAQVPAWANGGRPTLNPALFHLANVALHAADAVLVWRILRRVVGGTTGPAVVGALVFAVHPVQVEPVAWVSGFKDTFSGFWSLLAVVLALRSVATAGRPAWAAYAAATAAFGVALCAKPAAIVVPPMAAVLAWAAGDPRPRRTAALLAPWLLLALPIAWLTHAQQADAALMTWDPPAVRPLVAADAVAFYGRQLIWPAHLAVDYGRTPRRVWDGRAGVIVGIAAVAVAAAAVLVLGRRRRSIVAGVAVFVIGLGPVLGLVPFLYQQYSTVSDRYLYLPMVGVAVIVAAAARAGGRRGEIVAAVVVVALAVRAVVQVGVWRDTSALFAHNLDVNPDSAIAHAGLGTVAERAGDLAGAEANDRQAAALDPAEPLYPQSISRVLDRQGRRAEARWYQGQFLKAAAARVLSLDPDSPLAHRSLARAYALQGRPADAAAEAARAAALQAAGHVDVRPPGGPP